jgi:cytochrome c-type biogenesis protein
MDAVILGWYGPVLVLRALADRTDLPIAVAVVLGLIGATSPCQLTTNLGALAYASAHPGGARPLVLAGSYVAGKVSVYMLVGAAVVVGGLQLQGVSIPVVVVARKALGSLMIAVALGLFGVWRLRGSAGARLAWRLHERLRARGVAGAYLLGVAFSFAFCPTLFWLFFGLTVPLAIKSTVGWALPGLFALGASLPLLAITTVVAAGATAVESAAEGIRRIERPLRIGAAILLLVAGMHETLVYWFL